MTWKQAALIGAALLLGIGGSSYMTHVQAQKERAAITASRDSLVQRVQATSRSVDSLAALLASGKALYEDRARVVAAQTATARSLTDAALAAAAAKLAACDVNLTPLMDDVEAKLTHERLLADSAILLAAARADTLQRLGDSLVALDQLRRKELADAQVLINRALAVSIQSSGWAVNATAGLDIHGKPNVVVGIGYSIPLCRLAFWRKCV